jgi:hypothetical protein
MDTEWGDLEEECKYAARDWKLPVKEKEVRQLVASARELEKRSWETPQLTWEGGDERA